MNAERPTGNNLLTSIPELTVVLANLVQIIPEDGCPQGCSHCSQSGKFSKNRIGPEGLDQLIPALGRAYRDLRVSDVFREIYGYKSNDPGLYPHLDHLVGLVASELSTPLRISCQGFSRHSMSLTEMHQKIVEDKDLMKGLGRVRLSFTPFAPAFKKNGKYRQSYEEDMAHFLKLYRPLLGKQFLRSFGRNVQLEAPQFRVVLRYSPNISLVNFSESSHLLCVEGVEYSIFDKTESANYLEIRAVDTEGEEHVIRDYNIDQFFPETPYRLISVDPDTNYSVKNYLVKAGSEYAIATDRRRYFSWLRDEYIERYALGNLGEGATWSMVEEYMSDLRTHCSTEPHLQNELLPIVESLVKAYKIAGYSAETFFNRTVTKDAGVIGNQGRAAGMLWRVFDPHLPTNIPTTDRQFDELFHFVKHEGLGYAVAPNNNTVTISQIERIGFAYLEDNTAHVLDIPTTSVPRNEITNIVGYVKD